MHRKRELRGDLIVETKQIDVLEDVLNMEQICQFAEIRFAKILTVFLCV